MPASHRSIITNNQAKVLKILLPMPHIPRIDWPVLTRAQLIERAGYSPTNNINRILKGNKKPGLLTLGLVKVIMIDIDGLEEYNYQITDAGISAYNRHIMMQHSRKVRSGPQSRAAL